MSEVSADHLSRQAFVYIRQSTPDQLRHNHESRRRQYGLTVRARKLGWGEPVVIDEDLGHSGTDGYCVRYQPKVARRGREANKRGSVANFVQHDVEAVAGDDVPVGRHRVGADRSVHVTKRPPFDQLALQGGEEAFGHGWS